MAGVDKISLCNEAIAEIPGAPITDFTDNSVEAEWAARLYGPSLAFLLDAHDWKLPVARIALAEVTNDRSGEWSYAYAVPEDCASELRVLPDLTAASASVPLLAGQQLAPPTMAYPASSAMWRYAFLVQGSTIYCNVGPAFLEYIRVEPATASFRPLFARALVLELAQRMSVPVTKDGKRQRELIPLAAEMRERAIADDRNRDPSESRYDMGEESELQLAREGLAPGWGYSDGLWGDWYTR